MGSERGTLNHSRGLRRCHGRQRRAGSRSVPQSRPRMPPRAATLPFHFSLQGVFLMAIQTVGIIGAGTMGNGIAQACAVAGVERGHGRHRRRPRSTRASPRRRAASTGWSRRTSSRRPQKDAALARIKGIDRLRRPEGADLVIEAATENHELKLQDPASRSTTLLRARGDHRVEHLVDLDHAAGRRDLARPTASSACTSSTRCR